MEHLPVYISLIFSLTTCITVYLFYRATNRSPIFISIFLIWIIFQAIISLQGFYTYSHTFPPRFLFLILPPLMVMATLFFTGKGKIFINKLDLKLLTLLHVIRIPVELVLWWLSIYKAIPGIMTFHGQNFDIISGLSAPVIFYFGFIKKTINKQILLIWNFLCLGLLLNIVVIAILSAPLTFQKLAFEQPNVAMLYFPFVLLPCCIVPLVLFSHLASIRQLILQPGIPGRMIRK